MIIDMPIKCWSTVHVVKAELIFDIAPQHAAVSTWAVHRWHYDWRVTNVETGRNLSASGRGTKKSSIEAARELLAKTPIDVIAKKIEAAGDFS